MFLLLVEAKLVGTHPWAVPEQQSREVPLLLCTATAAANVSVVVCLDRYVLWKERNMLYTEREYARSKKMPFQNPARVKKVCVCVFAQQYSCINRSAIFM